MADRQTMTDEQRSRSRWSTRRRSTTAASRRPARAPRAVRAGRAGGVPKWGIADGGRRSGGCPGTWRLEVDPPTTDALELDLSGSDAAGARGRSDGEHQGGPWRADVPSGAGRYATCRHPRLADPPLLHLPRPRLRRPGHGALSVAGRRGGGGARGGAGLKETAVRPASRPRARRPAGAAPAEAPRLPPAASRRAGGTTRRGRRRSAARGRPGRSR